MIQREHNDVSSRTAALRGQGLLVKPHEARRLISDAIRNLAVYGSVRLRHRYLLVRPAARTTTAHDLACSGLSVRADGNRRSDCSVWAIVYGVSYYNRHHRW